MLSFNNFYNTITSEACICKDNPCILMQWVTGVKLGILSNSCCNKFCLLATIFKYNFLNDNLTSSIHFKHNMLCSLLLPSLRCHLYPMKCTMKYASGLRIFSNADADAQLGLIIYRELWKTIIIHLLGRHGRRVD